LCSDETGEKKKGKTTDSVARPSMGNLGTIAPGIVSGNADGVLDESPFPLAFEVLKPQKR
jgi:SRSO17 transposase